MPTPAPTYGLGLPAVPMDWWMDGDRLVITVDCSASKLEAAKPSASGKTRVVAKTGGFVPVGNVKFGLNVVVPRRAAD